MTIVPIPLDKSRSVAEFFRQKGEVEIPRPERCPNEECGLREPLWKNGKYSRQVIYWGLCFLLQICRFRCWRCGKTASCPYGWLVPYRRFSAEVIAAGIEAYGQTEIGYRDLSTDLSDLDLAAIELDIRKEELCKEITKPVEPDESGEPRSRPAHTTVFYWVNFACKRVEALLTQMQKEQVQAKKRGSAIALLRTESQVANGNSLKALSAEKSNLLNRLSYAIVMSGSLLGQSDRLWHRLRAYFATRAESRNDILTGTRVRLSSTQSFELAI